MITDLNQIYKNLVKEYGQVFVYEIGNEIYIYKLLSKKVYDNLYIRFNTDEDLQDEIVKACVLYPKDIDTDDMYFDDVEELANVIVNQSCILLEDRFTMLEMYSQEMQELDNVMVCLIKYAFPDYKIDEIESMSYPEFYRLYTRAEWVIKYLKKEPLEFSALDSFRESLHPEKPEQEEENAKEKDENTEGKYMGMKLSDAMADINKKDSKRKEMTEEQKRELERFQKQFPDIRMDQDAMYTGILSETSGTAQDRPRKKY